MPAVQLGRVALVDGDAMFNRPGPRLVDALEWMASTLFALPELAPPGFPAEWLSRPAQGQPAAQGWSTAPGASSKHGTQSAIGDIEEIHACAVREGRTTYIDPQTGYTVFTQLASEQRGRCCGNGCRHCSYDHMNVPASRKARLPPPIVVDRSQR